MVPSAEKLTGSDFPQQLRSGGAMDAWMSRKQTAGEKASRSDFEREMELARRIMDERWVVLRALALSDQHPDADVSTLLSMAEKQADERSKSSQS